MFVQVHRQMVVTTPLPEDALIPRQFHGQEGISRLFCYELDLVSERPRDVVFDKLLGQRTTLELLLPDDQSRHFSGIVSRVAAVARDYEFTHYRMQIVPRLWLLTRRRQSRIFQHVSVPEILKKVLEGIDVAYEIVGTFEPRDYCVQYRESDFNFVSRLMEEEGIYYYFKHTAGQHKMVVANTPQSHAALPGEGELIVDEIAGGRRDEERIWSWENIQELTSGKCTLWDHSFELPHRHLEAEKTIQDAVRIGKANYKLQVAGNEKLEIYDWPGGYANRFDGVNKAGGDRSADLQKIFADNERTVAIRMEEEAARSLQFRGASNCRQMISGHKFSLKHSAYEGSYMLTRVAHHASQALSADSSEPFHYENTFTCIPSGLPYRPPRVTRRPAVRGAQSAVVVGPPGEEIFTDKYGRIKVQFHWDRQGDNSADSSCWVRVASTWAGKRWGMLHIPRIGQEVLVDFLEGDPDNPVVVGSLYNADCMPAYPLPEHKSKSYLKSNSTPGSGGFNEIRFEDKKGEEQVFIHGEKDLDVRVKHDRKEWIGRDRHLIVARDKMEKVDRDTHLEAARDEIRKIGRDEHLEIAGKSAVKIAGSHSVRVNGDVMEEFQGNHSSQVTRNLYLKAMQVVIEASVGLTLKVGGNFITIDPSGIAIQGTPLVRINSGGAALSGVAGALVAPLAPTVAQEADKADPGEMTSASAGAGGARGRGASGRTSPAADAPTHDPNSEENKDKEHWIEIELVDEAGNPVAGETYQILLPDGTTLADGTLDEKGRARVEHIEAGTCKVTFPNLDKEAWKPK